MEKSETLSILNIPGELIEEILNHLVHWTFVENFIYYKAKLFLPYTQICRQIRNIALASPRLWRYIDLSHPWFCKEFLLRSKSAPITLITTVRSGELQVDPEILRPHASQICAVEVSLTADNIGRLFSVVTSNAHNISSLSVRNFASTFRLEFDFPSVRRLSLVGCSFRWDSCANLTLLHLMDPRHISTTMYFSELHDLLLRSPRLEELSLDCQIFFLQSFNFSKNVIHLPHLRHMTLSTDAAVISFLLRKMDSLPSSAHITIVDPKAGPMLPLPSGMSHLSSLQITPTTVLRFHAGMGLYLVSPDAQPWAYDKSLTHFSAPVARSSALHSSFRIFMDYIRGMLTAIPTHFDVSLLTTLELQTLVLNDIIILEHFMRSMPLLRTLRMDEQSASFIITALCTSQTNSSTPCPLLTCIEIGARDWPGPGDNYEEMSSQGYVSPIQVIAEGLRKRAISLGHPLHTLKFTGSLDAESIELLQQYVDKLLITVPREKGDGGREWDYTTRK